MDTSKLWRAALWAALITIFYNIFEGIVSVIFGYSDETLSLFGFGLDSFVEVISGLGVFHMIIRINKNSITNYRVFFLFINGWTHYYGDSEYYK